MNEKQIICIGGANIDQKAHCDPITMGTSNSVNFKKSFGGVAKNVAANLTSLGVPVRLMSFIGDDLHGLSILGNCQKKGIDTSLNTVIENFSTGTYTAILDHSGELQFALNDMEIYNQITWEMIERNWSEVRKACYVFADTNLPAVVLSNLINRSREENIKLILDPVSVEKSLKIPADLRGIYLLTPNRYEIKIISNTIIDSEKDLDLAAKNLFAKGLANVLIKMGDKGAYFCAQDEREKFLLSPYRTEVNDVTGAGDSMIAGIIYGLFHERDFKTCIDFGLRAAALTVRSTETVSAEMNIQNLEGLG